MKEVFKFKEFEVKQEDSAMKIGTDGVLLGAWTKIDNSVDSVLDIGSGTGLISLMMAQRSDAELIDAVELDPAAYEESVYNFENSPWGDRLFCYHSSFQEFAQEIEDSYDLIVSNPPFF
jgi:tRNA1Val (adenine37-N6)-methyltransferase